MGCHQCWTEYYRMQRIDELKERAGKGNTIRHEVNLPETCFQCGQPINTRNEAKEVWNAKRPV